VEKEMKRAKGMELRQLCQLAQVSRAGFYRWRKRLGRPADADLEVRDAIQRIALEFPCYGSRRVGFELERRGYTVNRKRAQRLMREDNLLCLRRQKFVVTTDSNHHLPVYPNLAATLVVTRVNRLWVADITPACYGGNWPKCAENQPLPNQNAEPNSLPERKFNFFQGRPSFFAKKNTLYI
jgi:transposase InsO family protein